MSAYLVNYLDVLAPPNMETLKECFDSKKIVFILFPSKMFSFHIALHLAMGCVKYIGKITCLLDLTNPTFKTDPVT